jgi:hypothetical protein
MSAWAANEVGLATVGVVLAMASLASLWRVGSWQVTRAAYLTFDEGLRIGSEAPRLVGSAASYDIHMDWQDGRLAFVVFGNEGCRSCDRNVSHQERTR